MAILYKKPTTQTVKPTVTNPRPQDMFGTSTAIPGNILGAPATPTIPGMRTLVTPNTPDNPNAVAAPAGGIGQIKPMATAGIQPMAPAGQPGVMKPMSAAGGIGVVQPMGQTQYAQNTNSANSRGTASTQNAVGSWLANNPQNTSGTGGTSPAQAAIDAYQKDLASANAANELRYGQLLDLNQQGGAAQLGDQNQTYAANSGLLQGQGQKQDQFLQGQYGQMLNTAGQQRTGQLGFQDQQRAAQMGNLDQFSDAGKQLEEQNRQAQIGNMQSSLQSRGLRGSTVVDSLSQGINNASQLRQMQLNDQTLDRRMGVEDQYTGRYGQTLANQDQTQLGLMNAEAGNRFGAMQSNDSAQANLANQYGANRNNLMGNLLGQRSGIIERRTDVAPNPAIALAYLNQARGGAAGGALQAGNKGGYRKKGGGQNYLDTSTPEWQPQYTF